MQEWAKVPRTCTTKYVPFGYDRGCRRGVRDEHRSIRIIAKDALHFCDVRALTGLHLDRRNRLLREPTHLARKVCGEGRIVVFDRREGVCRLSPFIDSVTGKCTSRGIGQRG